MIAIEIIQIHHVKNNLGEGWAHTDPIAPIWTHKAYSQGKADCNYTGPKHHGLNLTHLALAKKSLQGGEISEQIDMLGSGPKFM